MTDSLVDPGQRPEDNLHAGRARVVAALRDALEDDFRSATWSEVQEGPDDAGRAWSLHIASTLHEATVSVAESELAASHLELTPAIRTRLAGMLYQLTV